MTKLFDFNGLFIFEMANNHQGDVEHGKRIIRETAEIAKKHEIKAGIKLQFRDLDSFIHPDFRDRKDIKHIPRFMETRLTDSQFKTLIDYTRELGLIPIGTAFDEVSVDVMLELGIEIVKIGSCSAADQPLIRKVVSSRRPVIASVGGLNINQIDHLVGYFELKKVHFALMHCVAIYPTPINKFRQGQVEYLSRRYPEVPIGFSTHESPGLTAPIQLAYSKGARLFEKHVGVGTGQYKLNAYSSTPEQLGQWIEAYKQVVQMCGAELERPPAFPEETESLNTLKRGVWAKKAIKKGERIQVDDVFFAMPLQEGQLKSDYWNNHGFVADKDYEKNAMVNDRVVPFDFDKDEDLTSRIILQVKSMLREANINLGTNSSIEISHHFGLHRFREFGAVIVEVINRSYCKKLIVQLPRQKHPYHYHKKKEETFQLLHGDLEVFLEGESRKLEVGDTFLVKPTQWHKFQTLGGAIFEEISTCHYNDDSYYDDDKIKRMSREDRKTSIPNWEFAIIEKIYGKEL